MQVQDSCREVSRIENLVEQELYMSEQESCMSEQESYMSEQESCISEQESCISEQENPYLFHQTRSYPILVCKINPP